MGMLNKRSLTLLETLIVIALLIGLAAVVVPLAISSLGERAFESAADVTSEQLVLARAHAQSTGEAVEVRYRAATAQVEVRRFSPWLPVIAPFVNPGTVQQQSAAHKRQAMLDASTDSSVDSATETTIAEPWACRSLSRGIRIVDHKPQGAGAIDGGDGIAKGADTPEQDWVGAYSDDDIRLAVFMPDGSALMGAPVWFNDTDGRVGKLTINPWTGLPMFERVDEFSDQPLPMDDADEAAESNNGGLSKEKTSSGKKSSVKSASDSRTKGKAAATNAAPAHKSTPRDRGS